VHSRMSRDADYGRQHKPTTLTHRTERGRTILAAPLR
jgi:hypothetical protein